MILTGAEILIQCLIEQGVDTVFGYPGGKVLHIYDALYAHRDKIKHVLTSHEQGAGHAADGYARATGKPGVCIATSGPGATNLVTAIANAQMDSVPLVAITGNVPLSLLGKDSFQEVDIAGITMPVTKHNYIVKDVSRLADIVREAFFIAAEGRPGAVLIDIPENVTTDKCEYAFLRPVKNFSGNNIPEEAVEKAIRIIEQSQRPFVLAGGGASIANAGEELERFIKLLDAPAADTLMAKGIISPHEDFYMGMTGMHGTKAANSGIMKCDLLIVAGARFSDRVIGNASTFAMNAKVLQFDIDPAEINKNIISFDFVTGDINEILKRINLKLKQQSHREWMAYASELKKKYPIDYEKEVLTVPYIIEKLCGITGGRATITTEVGQHQMWTAQFYKFKEPHRFITSGGLGTMGFGLGAAIGASFGRPKERIINIAGDGSFRMNMSELATVSKYRLPITEIIINNRALGMVKQWQTMFYGKRYSCTELTDDIDYMKLADAFGVKGYRLTDIKDTEYILRQALSGGDPSLIEAVIDPDQMVTPMVPPGKSIDEGLNGA